MWRRRPVFLLLRVWLAAAAALAACDDGAPAPRGFGSRQLVSLRDDTMAFVGYGPGYVLYETGNGDPLTGNGLTHWRLNVETGALDNLGSSLGNPSSHPYRYSCSGEFSDTAGYVLTVTDTQTGIKTTIDHLSTYSPSCPTDADPAMVAWRNDDTRHVTLWSGPYDQLQQQTLPILVVEVVRWGGDAATVVGARPEDPDALGIFSVDVAMTAVRDLVPPLLDGAAWAAGATPAGPLESRGIKRPTYSLPITQLGDTFAYPRTMSDGGTTMFLGPFPPPAARELALFRVAAGSSVDQIPVLAGRVPSDSAAWQYGDAAGDVLFFWHAGSDRLVSCPVGGALRPAGYASRDGRFFAFGVSSGPSSVVPGQPLVLVSPEGAGRDGVCTLLAEDHAHDHQLSLDGTAIAWMVDPPGQQTALWTAAADGSNARELGRGPIQVIPWAPRFFADSRLELRLDRDLVWVDVHDDPVNMHYVAEHTFDVPVDFGRWVLIGYEFSEQDATGRLGLVERETGNKRLLSSQVVTYENVGPSTAAEDRRYVVYVVRGRDPSPQDGLWVATITADDVR